MHGKYMVAWWLAHTGLIQATQEARPQLIKKRNKPEHKLENQQLLLIKSNVVLVTALIECPLANFQINENSSSGKRQYCSGATFICVGVGGHECFRYKR